MTPRLPAKILDRIPKMAESKGLRLEPTDTLIHSPGFEDRTLAFAQGLIATHGSHAVLLDYRPINRKNKLGEATELLKQAGVDVTSDDHVIYDRFDPSDFETRLQVRLAAHGTKRAVIDISTMSKLAIILVLKACQELKLNVTVIYSEAKQYGPSKEEFDEAQRRNEIHRPTLHVFSGVHGVVRANSVSSVAMQGQPTAAIVFMSFNDALTQLLLNTVYPSRLFLINGTPPVHSWREQATAWVHEQVRKEWEDDNPLKTAEGTSGLLPARCASTLDYRDSLVLLLDLYWALSATHRVLLAPSGSKMQTIACFIMKALHPDVHIEYPSPEGFAPEYSHGIGRSWRVDFGDLCKTLTHIQESERRAFLEIAA
jgi:hypothetical protein